MNRGFNKTCTLEDFSDPDLVAIIRDVFAHEAAAFPDLPQGREFRKHWEIGMAVASFREFGALRPDAELLGVGVGTEPTMYWLTNHVRRVFATDLYAGAGDWSPVAPTWMLTNPGRDWPNVWNRRRLVVQHMNALELEYEDNSFDGIFSCSSLEHFGSRSDVRLALDEMFRVLKPGGVLAISTEFRLEGNRNGLPGTLLFDEADIQQLVTGSRSWDLATPLQLAVSDETLSAAVPVEEAMEDSRSGNGWSRYPHIVLRFGEHLWTSVHLTLVKR